MKKKFEEVLPQNKLSEKEFDKLQKIKNEAIEIATNLGELEYQKISTELKIEEQKEKIRSLKAEEAAFFEEITETYGNVVINIETGTISKQSENEDA
jgi:hypothetical protein